jgi:hypothetical protein
VPKAARGICLRSLEKRARKRKKITEKTLVYHTVRRKLQPVPKTNVYHLTTKPPGITHNQAREDHALVLTPMFLKSDPKRGC